MQDHKASYGVDHHGRLTCEKIVVNLEAGICGGVVRPYNIDRFTYLMCKECGHTDFTQGVDNHTLYDVHLRLG